MAEMCGPQTSPTHPLHVDGGQDPYRHFSAPLGPSVKHKRLKDARREAEHQPEGPNHHRPTDRPADRPTTPPRPEKLGHRRHPRARPPGPARPNPPAPTNYSVALPPAHTTPHRPHTPTHPAQPRHPTHPTPKHPPRPKR